MSHHEWIIWAFILIAQNFAFTFVSRARNSGSLMRHMKDGTLPTPCYERNLKAA